MKRILTLFIAFVSILSFGQFEQKLTFNFSVGMVSPFGEPDYLKTDIANDNITGTYAQPYPYLMSNFGNGTAILLGAQINSSRRFSMAFSVQFLNIRKWYYEYEWTFMTDPPTTTTGSWMGWKITEADIQSGGSSDVVLKSGENRLTMYNLSFAAMPKIYLLPGRSVNPYFFGELSINLTNLNLDNSYGNAKAEYGIQNTSYEPVETIMDQSLGLGTYPGFGLEVAISKYFGLYLQSGFSIIFISNDKLDEAGFPAENFKSFKIDLGMKFSFLRSKNL